jgi:hypothetical protein
VAKKIYRPFLLLVLSVALPSVNQAGGRSSSTTSSTVPSSVPVPSFSNPGTHNVSNPSGFAASPETHGEETNEFPVGTTEGGNSIMKEIAQSATNRIGQTNGGKPICYHAVKTLIADGLGKDEGCVRGIISGAEAKDALQALPRAGFVNDMSKCHVPGVILVYRGRHLPGYRHLAGDTAGHIEVLGSDGGYHSFFNGSEPISKTMPGRRILAGCFVADESKINSGPLAKCKNVARKPARSRQTKGAIKWHR